MKKIVDLQLKGLRLWQDTRFLCFSQDSQRLSEFAARCCPNARRVCELGSGNGGLLLSLWARLSEAECTGVELMKANVELARQSVLLNSHLPEIGRCRFVCADWRDWHEYLPAGAYDLLVSNPPFWQADKGRLSPVPERRAATHELNGSLWDMLLAADGLLAKGGNLCVLLPSERTAELQELLHKLHFMSVKQENFADRVMIWAKKR